MTDAAEPRYGDFAVAGTPWGLTLPRVPARPPPFVDARTMALSVLRAYVASLRFARPGNTQVLPNGDRKDDPPIPFTIPVERFHLDPPDDEVGLEFPCMTVASDEEQVHQPPGFVPYVDESTAELFGRGTVLLVKHEDIEMVRLEMWATTLPQRRAMVARMEGAFSPSEEHSGLRLRMLDYYGQTVMFTPQSTTRRDLDAVRGRRMAAMRLEMRHRVVELVDYATMQPVAVLDPIGPQVVTEVERDP